MQHSADTTVLAAAKFAPNHFLGTCLDQAWVEQVEHDFGVSTADRDALGRLLDPYLHSALATPRFTVDDPRTNVPMASLYQRDCVPPDSVIYGVGAKLDANGNVLDPGRVNGTLILELKGWASILLTTMVFSIITQELFGYEIAFFQTTNADSMAERMSSSASGVCAPVHANLEVWADPALVELFKPHANEWYNAGSIGYNGRSGLYTTTAFIRDGLDPTKQTTPFVADYWRDYSKSEALLKSLPVSALKANAKFYPPTEVTCADGSFGCRDSCSKTEACTQREAQGKECMVVVMMYNYYDSGYTEAVFANLGIAAYFCFIGATATESIAIEAAKSGKPVVFYHYEPDPFHFQHEGLFERILLPLATPELAKMTTGAFGEHGYGGKTDNPVKVDYPTTSLEKFAASFLEEHEPLESLLSRMSLAEYDMNQLLQLYVNATRATAAPPVDDPVFTAACTWLKANYRVWSLWLGRLPMCDLATHVSYDINGCDATAAVRTVVFKWTMPDPTNPRQPYDCDGGVLALPPPLVTSRSCAWLQANEQVWVFWSAVKPMCDASFYDYNISACDRAGSKREVVYYWMLADPTNASLSAECAHGDALPTPVLLDCEYVPDDFDGFVVVAVIAAILGSALVAAMAFVFHFRDLPIIKRSQYQFLLVLLAGGVIICASVCVYAGAPTTVLCSIRPMGISFGFTLIFGALVVKSLRVYRVFMSGAMKRVVLSTKTMFKILGVFVAIDIVILAAWNVADPSKPVLAKEATAAIGGDEVERLRCTSTSFIYTALLIFWKAVLLFAGLYLSFLIRKVSSDFQESVWIFASAVIVLFTSLILLPMAYLVDLPATTFYLFFSFLLLASTATVMGLMVVPKILRLHAESAESVSSSEATSGGSRVNSDSSDRSKRGDQSSTGFRKVTKLKRKDASKRMVALVPGPKKSSTSKVKVTPVKQFTPES